MLGECSAAKNIWQLLEEYINRTAKISFKFGKVDIIFGYLFNNQYKIPVNAIILITKKYIFEVKSRNVNFFAFNLDTLIYRFKQTYVDEKYLAALNDQKEKFNNTEEMVTSVWYVSDKLSGKLIIIPYICNGLSIML